MLSTFSQGLNSELTFGAIVHSRSGFIGGLQTKYVKKNVGKWSTVMSAELVNIRHTKELRIPTQYSGTFVLGKTNYLFVLRPQYGIDRLLFAKDPDDGVKVSLQGVVGPSLAVVKPYMIEKLNNDETTSKVQYTEDVDLTTIIGNAGWYRGFGQSKFTGGLNAKMSLNFEYSTIKKKVSAIELGFLYEQLASQVELNPFVNPESSFFIAFVTLSFGKKL